MKYREALNSAMIDAVTNHNSIIIGQGVTDHKGIFGTTLGIEGENKNRLIETPLSEDSIMGVCVGAALNGIYPINTHIRADFSLLTFNQLVNLAAKYKYMFGGLFEVPLLVRLVIGRSWGQGAQHSQSLQSLLSHIPGLHVIMPTTPESIINSYNHAIKNIKAPVVSLEHRLMYELEIEEPKVETNDVFGTKIDRHGKDVTIITTSIMLLEARRAAKILEEQDIDVEIIDLFSISHPNKNLIIESVKKTGRLVVADTSWAPYGVCAEMSRIIAEFDPSILKAPIKSLSMAPSPCPTAKSLEDKFYPGLYDIIKSVSDVLGISLNMPQNISMTDFYKHFKGPF